MSLYPRLVANSYSITYLAGSATSGSAPAAGSYTTGSTAYTIVGNAGSLERTFCTFGGWNSQSGGGGSSYYVGSTYSSPSNLELYPLWTGCTTYPDPPTSLTATATGENSATLSFTAPVSDGGMTMTSYTFVSTPGSITATYSGSGSGTVTFRGLAPDTSYTFVGYATNNNGNSINSLSSNSITTFGVGLTPTFDSPISVQEGFTVNITNYNPNYLWTVSVNGGYVVELSFGGSIRVTGINNSGFEATVTVTTSRSGFSNKSASVTGYSRLASPDVNLRELKAPSISVTGNEVTCSCGEYRYVTSGWMERPAEIQAIIYVLFLDDKPIAVSEYDPRDLLAPWMAPTVESLGVSGIASKESARFTISREFKSARCELMMFESPTLHLGKTTSFYR